MPMKRKKRHVFWPLVTALAIAGVLFVREHLEIGSHSNRGRGTEVTQLGGSSGAGREFFPRPLEGAPSSHRAFQRLASTVAVRASLDGIERPVPPDPTEILGKLPAEVPVVAQLHAPLLEPDLESTDWNHSVLVTPLLRTQGVAYGSKQTVDSKTPATIKRLALQLRSSGWPDTPSLNQMLEQNKAIPEARQWSTRIAQLLQQLGQQPALASTTCGPILDQLASVNQDGFFQAEQHASSGEQTTWLRALHAVNRRLAVWKPIWVATSSSAKHVSKDTFSIDQGSIRHITADVVAACEATGDGPRWRKYLLLETLNDPKVLEDPAKRQNIAIRFLARLSLKGLSQDQLRWLSEPTITRLAAAVRPWASGPIDYPGVLRQLERQESNMVDRGASTVAAAAQTLRFSGGPSARQTAMAIDTYYRNANLRLAVSDRLLGQILPEIPVQQASVRESILGARVRGTSQVASRLDIQFAPSEDSWSLRIRTDGHVRSATSGRKGFVTIRSNSQTQFAASTPLTITPNWIRVGDARVKTWHASKLQGLSTGFDNIPLIGSLVRGIALLEYRKSLPLVRKTSAKRAQCQISDKIETQIESRVAEASEKLSRQLLGPLTQLHLEPKVIDLRTETHRISARYRVAGEWQLAAFTPRPRAPADSLLSIQLHQSAINNTIERMLAFKESRSISDVAKDVLRLFGKPDAQTPLKVPTDVYIKFARTRPISVEIQDGRLQLTFRIARLRKENGIDLRAFIVRAAYKPQIEGNRVFLVRDGHLSVIARRPSIRSRLPVRAIFNEILDESSRLPMISSSLAEHPAIVGTRVSQCELRDGWIGLAISSDQDPLPLSNIATKPASSILETKHR